MSLKLSCCLFTCLLLKDLEKVGAFKLNIKQYTAMCRIASTLYSILAIFFPSIYLWYLKSFLVMFENWKYWRYNNLILWYLGILGIYKKNLRIKLAKSNTMTVCPKLSFAVPLWKDRWNSSEQSFLPIIYKKSFWFFLWFSFFQVCVYCLVERGEKLLTNNCLT